MSIKFLSGINVDSNTLFVDDANDRVGIGTGSPATALDVNGTISVGGSPLASFSGNYNRILRPNGTVGIYLGNATDAGNYYDNTTHYFRSSAGASTYAVINNLGNVGIGTTSPAQKLHVQAPDLGTSAGDQTYAALFQASNGNSSFLEIKDVRTDAGSDWTGAGKRIQMRIDSTYMGYIQFNGNSNNYGMSFGTGGVTSAPGNVNEVMRITNAGNVGIGTTSPSARLHVSSTGETTLTVDSTSSGTARINLTGAGGGAGAVTSTTNGLYLYASGANHITLNTNGSERVRVSSDGKVGIAVTSLTASLSIGSSSYDGNPLTGIEYAQVTGGGRLDLKVQTWGTGSNYGLTTGLSVVTPGFDTADVRVGIGTTAPGAKLQIGQFDSNLEFLRISNSYDTGRSARGGINWHDTTNTTGRIYTEYDGTMVSMVFGSLYNNGYNSNNLMIIRGNGNVGIGTTSPSYKLDVAGDINTSSGVYRIGGNTILSGTTSVVVGSGGATGSVTLRTTSGDGLVLNGGNVGIGTTSPAEKIVVSGGSVGIAIDGTTSSRTYYNRSGAYIWSTGLRSGDTKFHIFDERATDRLVIDDSGNVGIGTTAPGYLLDVAGTSRSDLHIFRSNQSAPTADAFIFRPADNTIALGTANAERMRITSAGNVGIGTTAPEAKLSIVSGAGEAGLLSRNASIGDTWFPYSNGQNYIRGITNFDNASAYFTGGNVGIGTTSPITKLTVGSYSGSRLPYINGTANTFDANGITVTSSNTGNASIGGGIDLTNNVHSVGSFSPLISFSALSQSGTYNNNYAAIYGILAGDSGDGNWNSGHLVFATALAYGASEKMRITNAGNVGIGTTAPANRLQVGSVGSSGYSGNDIAIGNGTQVMSFFQSSTVSVWYTNTQFALMPSGAGSTGNVGIGNTSPTQALHVSGNLRVTGAYYDSSNASGTSGQVLSSTGSGTDWVSLSEISGVDGTGTANYIAKWSDTDTIANSSITDNGSTVTANVSRLNMNRQAGIYTFEKTVAASTASDFFSISNTHGAQAFRVTFVCSTSGYSVAKTYEVVHAYGQTPIYFKVVDTGPFGSEDFDVAFANSNSDTGTKATVTNNSTTTAGNIVATVFLGGGYETITVTAL